MKSWTAILLVACVGLSLTLALPSSPKCPAVCDKSKCLHLEDNQCIFGKGLDSCNCCTVCLMGPNQPCGTVMGQVRCGPDSMACVGEDKTARPYKPGLCEIIPTKLLELRRPKRQAVKPKVTAKATPKATPKATVKVAKPVKPQPKVTPVKAVQGVVGGIGTVGNPGGPPAQKPVATAQVPASPSAPAPVPRTLVQAQKDFKEMVRLRKVEAEVKRRQVATNAYNKNMIYFYNRAQRKKRSTSITQAAASPVAAVKVVQKAGPNKSAKPDPYLALLLKSGFNPVKAARHVQVRKKQLEATQYNALLHQRNRNIRLAASGTFPKGFTVPPTVAPVRLSKESRQQQARTRKMEKRILALQQQNRVRQTTQEFPITRRLIPLVPASTSVVTPVQNTAAAPKATPKVAAKANATPKVTPNVPVKAPTTIAKPKTVVKPAPTNKPVAKAKVKSGVKTNPTVKAKPTTKAVIKPVVKAGTKPVVKANPTAKAKPKVKPVAKAKTKTAAKAKSKTKAAPKK